MNKIIYYSASLLLGILISSSLVSAHCIFFWHTNGYTFQIQNNDNFIDLGKILAWKNITTNVTYDFSVRDCHVDGHYEEAIYWNVTTNFPKHLQPITAIYKTSDGGCDYGVDCK